MPDRTAFDDAFHGQRYHRVRALVCVADEKPFPFSTGCDIFHMPLDLRQGGSHARPSTAVAAGAHPSDGVQPWGHNAGPLHS